MKMKNLIRLCLITFFLLNIVESSIIYYSDILECNYQFQSYSDSKMTLTIDGHKYRETVTQPNVNTYFAIPVNKKNYNISYHLNGNHYSQPKLTCKYTSGLILDNMISNKDILIKNNQIPLLQTDYVYHRKHILNIYLVISMKPYDSKQETLQLDLYFNNKLIKSNILTSLYPGISYKLELEGLAGINFLELISSTNGIWCSCPTMFNGFDNNRYLISWITELNNDYKSIGIVTSNERIIFDIGNNLYLPDIISI